MEHHGAAEGRLANLGDGAAVAETEHVEAATDVIGTVDGDVFNVAFCPAASELSGTMPWVSAVLQFICLVMLSPPNEVISCCRWDSAHR